MKKREFDKYLNACRTRGKRRVDLAKLRALPDDVKTGMALWIIRNRGPVLADLITAEIDQSWLACMGYMYKTTGKVSGFTFVHTCEHTIR